MNIETLHIGMKVRHPQYGVGEVRAVSEHTAEIRFGETVRTISPETAELEPAEAQVAITGLSIPLAQFIQQIVAETIEKLGVEKPDSAPVELGARWHNGRLVLHPADPALQTKEIPLEVFFHKLVMMRNQLRVLEQKINSNQKLTEAEKIELDQYVTRCYGSMTTFNLLFKDKQGQF